MELPADGPLLPHEPNWRGRQRRKTIQNIVTVATTTTTTIVIITVEAGREMPLQ